MDSSTASATGLRGAHSSQMVEVSVSSSSGSGSSNGHYLHEITNLDNVYWLMPVGFLVGLTVVVIFERMQKGSKKSERKALFKSLTNGKSSTPTSRKSSRRTSTRRETSRTFGAGAP